ncbi:hypothetical protein GCM10010121_072050 [Streptomyces brasiliensis]|uniref:Uncharacterized protein n=1 Tax=Streptomyces brasiliensis TaxID=1954 RepID=A0A917L8R4_9ACTN|nr:hypothetical protein GCM10010121_072050 [Streptomyces brasiliensis]
MRTGDIARHCLRYSVVFDPSETGLAIRARTSEVREALAVDSIAAAAPRFVERSLRGGEWNPDKGAGMSTYFVGGCVMAFGDVFKVWSRKRRRGRDPGQCEAGQEPARPCRWSWSTRSSACAQAYRHSTVSEPLTL